MEKDVQEEQPATPTQKTHRGYGIPVATEGQVMAFFNKFAKPTTG
jgi:hypothetical protein